MELLTRQECHWHPERPSRAMCMTCRRPGCEECTTQSEGIHYCSSCLAARQQTAVAVPKRMRLIAMIVLSLLLAFAIVRLSVGIGAALAVGLS